MFPKTLGLKLSSFKEDINGTIAIMSAGLLMVGIGAAAIAVDIGSLYTERRTLQGVADLAAMTAASNIDNAEALVTGMLAANSIEATFDIERGKYTPDPKLSDETRFEPGATPHNALRVNLSHFGTTYFARALTQEPIKDFRSGDCRHLCTGLILDRLTAAGGPQWHCQYGAWRTAWNIHFALGYGL